MRTLSIMIDEAGNFDMEHYSNPFYCLTLVFQDQDIDISSDIVLFNSILESTGFQSERAVHASPLIRKEFPYQEIEKRERKRLFSKMTAFVSHLPIRYKTFFFDKKQTDSDKTFLAKMLNEVREFIKENLSFFHSFDSQIIYYDRGQRQISSLIKSSFEYIFKTTLDIRLAFQNDYKLLQAADFLCTIEYTKKKWDLGIETKSERDFFESRRYFVQNYYHKVKKLQLA